MSKGLVIAGIMVGCLCASSRAAETPGTAELVADVESIQPGTPFMAGVLLRMPEGWHTYWLNSGDSGMPPEMDWQLPAGFTAGPVLWPAPKMFDEPPVTSFGYDNEVLLAREIRPPADLAIGQAYTFEVNTSWLVCKDVCIPKTGRLRLTLPSRADAPAESAKWKGVFAGAKQAAPVRDSQWKFRATADKSAISLCVISPPDAGGNVAKAEFFPAQANLVEYGPQTWTDSRGELCLRMTRIQGGEALPARFEGVLVVPQEKETKALEVNTALEK